MRKFQNFCPSCVIIFGILCYTNSFCLSVCVVRNARHAVIRFGRLFGIGRKPLGYGRERIFRVVCRLNFICAVFIHHFICGFGIAVNRFDRQFQFYAFSVLFSHFDHPFLGLPILQKLYRFAKIYGTISISTYVPNDVPRYNHKKSIGRNRFAYKRRNPKSI